MIVQCETCNKEFNKSPSIIKRGNHNFCSRKCFGIWSREHLSEKTIQKMRERMLGAKNPMFGKVTSEETKQKIREATSGEKSYYWRGGIHKHRGYVFVYTPEHPFANYKKYVAEHRLVMEEFLGRYLTQKERVHHINEIHDDNRIENLMLFTGSGEHTRYHKKLIKLRQQEGTA